MNNLSIGQRLVILMSVGGILLLAVTGIGWKGGRQAVHSLQSVFEDNVVPMHDLGRIGDLLSENTAELLLAIQHDPTNRISAAHDHAVDVHVENFNRRRGEISKLWDKYMALPLSEQEKALANDFAVKRKIWVERASELLGRIKGGDYSPQLMMELLAARRELGVAAAQSLLKLQEMQMQDARSHYESALSDHDLSKTLFVIIVLGGLVAASGFAWVLGRSITRPIHQSVEIAEAIAGGDLTKPVPHGGSDEAGRLLLAFARMQDGLRKMVGDSQRNAEELARASETLSTAAQQAASASEAQSEAASGMAASVEEMSVSIDQVRDHAREARNIAGSAGDASLAGGNVVHASAEEMGKVAGAVNEAAVTIRELENYSNEISAIINVIREVADQTNLLALNAAIEAARAGEQGRGFAVVADEVRKLAERTSESTHTISSVIEKVQAGARKAAQEMESGVARVNEGVSLAHQAGDSITGIQEEAGKVVSAVAGIGVALDEQSAAAQEIARGVERIASMSEQNSASVRQTSAAAGRLHELAGSLEQSFARFRV